MKIALKTITLTLLLFVCFSCEEEEPLLGSATLRFTGDIINREINIYPGEVYSIQELLNVYPLIEGRSAANQRIVISDLNPGNYTWYDLRNNIGFFQITAGQNREFEYELR